MKGNRTVKTEIEGNERTRKGRKLKEYEWNLQNIEDMKGAHSKMNGNDLKLKELRGNERR